MTRPLRPDARRSWHHVMHRGISRRTGLETRAGDETCSLSDAEAWQRLRCGESGARKLPGHHRSRIGEGGEYAEQASEVAVEALRKCGLG